jgi:apoptosis-inducing factor 3
MGGGSNELKGPDLKQGVPAGDVREGQPLLGHADGEAVFLLRRGENVHALGATCTHYSGPLSEGLVVGETIRCPWHHACFDLKTGEARGGPALSPVASFDVERRGELLVLGKRREIPDEKPARSPASIVLVGAGPASAAAAEELRKRGYRGPITIIGADTSDPVDRPNLSKDYLAGTAPEEWLPLRPRELYVEKDIELMLGVTVTKIDVAGRKVELSNGNSLGYGALLLATGAEPVRLPIPGADAKHVFTLRSLADSRAIIAAAANAKRAVVIGASFIGLEVAASLRARGVEVVVVGPETLPLEKILGEALGRFVQALHEEHGVQFALGKKAISIDEHAVTLDDGKKLEAELVVMGVGVSPRLDLARAAGLTIDGGGVATTERLESSVPGIFAAGDIAAYPDARTGERTRIEHWVVAERQGQAAARAMLGSPAPYRDIPFFWSQHYDVAIAYVGHATRWDEIVVRGEPAKRDCLVAFKQDKKVRAVATIFRDDASLHAEAAMERGDDAALEALIAK